MNFLWYIALGLAIYLMVMLVFFNPFKKPIRPITKQERWHRIAADQLPASHRGEEEQRGSRAERDVTDLMGKR